MDDCIDNSTCTWLNLLNERGIFYSDGSAGRTEWRHGPDPGRRLPDGALAAQELYIR